MVIHKINIPPAGLQIPFLEIHQFAGRVGSTEGGGDIFQLAYLTPIQDFGAVTVTRL